MMEPIQTYSVKEAILIGVVFHTSKRCHGRRSTEVVLI